MTSGGGQIDLKVKNIVHCVISAGRRDDISIDSMSFNLESPQGANLYGIVLFCRGFNVRDTADGDNHPKI